MATLYEYRMAYRYAFDAMLFNDNAEFVNEDGEVLSVDEYLKSLEGDIHEKVEATILFTKELEADIDGIKKEIKALKERLEAKQNKFDKLREGVANAMLEIGETKYETPRMSLSFRKSETVEIADDFEIPQAYLRRKVTEEPDKTLIKKALKNGEVINGATLIVHQNLQVK